MTHDSAKSTDERFTLILQRPAEDELAEQDKRGKYTELTDHNATLIDRFRLWLEEHGLTEDVKDISEPTAFSMVFVTTNKEVAQRLKEAPGVLSVAVEPEFEVNLPDQPENLVKGEQTEDGSPS